MALTNRFLVFICVVALVSAELPSYIKKCKKDEHLNDCIVTNGQTALQSILAGDDKLGIPCFDPYWVKSKFTFGSAPGVVLETENLELRGYSQMKLVKANWDFENQRFTFKVTIANTTAYTDYKVNGPFKGHTLRGEGRATIFGVDITLTFNVKYGTEFVDDVKYVKLENIQLAHHIRSVIFNLENLTDADHCPEAELNKLISDNWEDWNKATQQDNSRFFTTMGEIVLNTIFKTVPFDQFFE